MLPITRRTAAAALAAGALTSFAVPASAAERRSIPLLGAVTNLLTGATTTTTTATTTATTAAGTTTASAPVPTSLPTLPVPTVPVDTAVVTNLVNQIVSTTPVGTTPLPTPTITAVVTDVLASGVTPTLPAVDAVVDSVTATVADPAQAPTQVPILVSTLLAGGADPAVVAGAVNEVLTAAGAPTAVVEAAVDSAVGQLLAVGLPTDATALEGVVSAVIGGAAPTGAILEPVAQVLDGLAANTALPADVRQQIAALAADVRAAGTQPLSQAKLTEIADVLSTVAGTASVPKPVGASLGTLSGLFGPKPKPTAPPVTAPKPPTTGPALALTSAMRARIAKVAVSKDRKKAKVSLRCPASAVIGCAVTTQARYAGKNVGKASSVVMRPGESRTVTVKLPKKTTRALKRKGGKLGARAVTYLGANLKPSASRTVEVRKAKRR